MANLHDKEEYIVHVTNFKQTLNYGLVLKKAHRIIKFHQKVWLISHIDMNTEFRKNRKI